MKVYIATIDVSLCQKCDGKKRREEGRNVLTYIREEMLGDKQCKGIVRKSL